MWNELWSLNTVPWLHLCRVQLKWSLNGVSHDWLDLKFNNLKRKYNKEWNCFVWYLFVTSPFVSSDNPAFAALLRKLYCLFCFNYVYVCWQVGSHPCFPPGSHHHFGTGVFPTQPRDSSPFQRDRGELHELISHTFTYSLIASVDY